MRSSHYRTGNTIAAICAVVVFLAHSASASTLPPGPDNAALVYYRAYLLDPGPDRPWSMSLSKFLSGNGPLDDDAKYDLRIREHKIELIETAAKIPKCDWGLEYSDGFSQSNHFSMMIQLANLLAADAKRLAIEGQHRAALKRSLTIRQLARHIGDEETFAYLVAQSLIGRAETSVRHVLEIMPTDVDTLTWLKGRLSEEIETSLSLDRALRMDFELALLTLRTQAEILVAIRQELVKKTPDENSQRPARDLTDEELIAWVRDTYAPFLETALQIIHSGKPCRETYARLKDLRQELEEEHGGDPAAKRIIIVCADNPLRSYNTGVVREVSSNALRAAVEIYLEIAKTKRVPFMPPESVPKDPCSGKDFQYETTKDGFLFRCSAPDSAGGTILRPFEFKVRDPNRQREPWERAADPATSALGQRKNAPAQPNRAPGAQGSAVKTTQEDVTYTSANDLEAIIKDESVPAEVRARAETALMRLKARTAKGSPTPEPLLARASLCRIKEGGAGLNIVAIDQDHDVIGLRVKEAYVDSNGRTTSQVEAYPAYLERYTPWRFEEEPLLPVAIRDKGQRKNFIAWEVYLIDCYNLLAETRSGTRVSQRIYGPAMPPVWISKPEGNNVRIFVCLYDGQGHESEYVEVEDLLNRKPVDPLMYKMMFQSWLEKQSKQ